jgi:hypothetical protein
MLAACLRTTAFCVAVIVLLAYFVPNAASGPRTLPWFEAQDSGICQTAAGSELEEGLAEKVIAPMIR